MKTIFYFISLPALLIILNCSVCWAQEISGPKMVLEERIFDAEEVMGNTTIEHEFKVLNEGDSPLEIKNVRTS